MDVVSGANAPEDERAGEKNQTGCEGPEAFFCFHDAVVTTGEVECEPVAEAPGE